MSSYSVEGHAGGGVSPLYGDTASTLTIISFRVYGEITTTATIDTHGLRGMTQGFPSSLSPVSTAEKLNSRSPVSSLQNNSLNTPGNIILSYRMNAFSHQGWTNPRPTVSCQRIYDDLSGVDLATGSTNAAFYMVLSSSSVSVVGPRKRCRGKKGLWHTYGNIIHLNASTVKSTHFDNDITWIDPFAWGLGTGIEPLNANLFPAAAATKPERTLLGVGT